jgi:YfiH family protein
VFAHREAVRATSTSSRVEVAFTDSSLDLQVLRPAFPDELARLEAEVGLAVARTHQVHGDRVHVVAEVPLTGPIGAEAWPEADAQVTALPGVALMVRVADCVPVLLADADARVVAAVHAGRKGVALDVVTRAVEAMRDLGAGAVTGWIGPHVCGSCYEVPAEMRAEVGAVEPDTVATTRWGTPGLDLGAGVRAQLVRAGVRVVEVDGCTLEDPRFHSHRRDGADSGRFAGLVWIDPADGAGTTGPGGEVR